MDMYLLVVGILAGFVGSLSGLGGGIIVTPALTLLFGIPFEYAAGTSLIATIATSSGAAVAFIKDKITNLKIGMSLEIATTIGAILGAHVAAMIYAENLRDLMYIIFGFVLMLSIVPSLFQLISKKERSAQPDQTTRIFQMEGNFYDQSEQKERQYAGVRWWLGETVMFIAGIVSGLLGIGSGALKVIGMDWVMRLPIKVSTSTSNFMIGVTAAAGSGVYLASGFVKPSLVAPIVIGVLAGSYLGSKMMVRIKSGKLRLFFIFIIFVLAVQMILRGYGKF